MKYSLIILLCSTIMMHSLWSIDKLKEKPYLGIMTSSIRANIKQHLNLPNNSGVMIEHVFKNSAAEKVGLNKGQVLVRVNECYIDTPNKLMSFIQSFKPGDLIELELMDKGVLVYKNAELIAKPIFNHHISQKNMTYKIGGVEFKNFLPHISSGNNLNSIHLDLGSMIGSGNFNLKDIQTEIKVIPFDQKIFKSKIKVSSELHNVELEHGDVGQLNKVIVLDSQGNTLVNSSDLEQLKELPYGISEVVHRIIDDVQIDIQKVGSEK